jgi:hypothetical protein
VVWTSAADGGEPGAPSFGHATDVFNVIDIRQSYLQNIVAAGLRALGFESEASRSVHFSYEIVALSPRCAAEMGYTLSEEEARKPYVEVSGRKGLGVKADDLLDRLEAAARAEVDTRQPEAPDSERLSIAHVIAVGALRYFLLKFTRTAIIAFDFREALVSTGKPDRIVSTPSSVRETFFARPSSSNLIFEWRVWISRAKRRPMRSSLNHPTATICGRSSDWPAYWTFRWRQRWPLANQRSSRSTPSSWRKPSISFITAIASVGVQSRAKDVSAACEPFGRASACGCAGPARHRSP